MLCVCSLELQAKDGISLLRGEPSTSRDTSEEAMSGDDDDEFV